MNHLPTTCLIVGRRWLSYWAVGCLVAMLAGCAKRQELLPINVFAAASTAEAIDEIVWAFELSEGTPMTTNYAASSVLAQQIAAGAPADVFLSASTAWADFLEENKLVLRRQDLLGNRLVVIVHADRNGAVTHIDDLAEDAVQRVALADPESVPAGIYARQALEKLNLWEAVRPKVVVGGDVREALLLVERGEADAGIVYFTDALITDKVLVAVKIDPGLHAPIRYPLVLIKRPEKNPLSERLFERLTSPAAATVFQNRGFTILDAEIKGE